MPDDTTEGTAASSPKSSDGATGASTNAGTVDNASQAAADREAIQAVIRDTLGLKPGQNLSHIVANTSKSILGDALKGFGAEIDAKLAALKPKEKPKEPDEVESLKGTIGELQGAVKSMSEKAAAAESRAAEQARQQKIADIIDKANIAPEMRASFRNLAVHGLLDGIGKPVLDPDTGEAVIQSASGVLPFGDALDGFLKREPHWIARYKAAGSGAGGAGPGAGTVSAKPVEFTTEGLAALAKETEGNPEAFQARIAAEHAAKRAKLFGK
jgi:hypothetical protein